MLGGSTPRTVVEQSLSPVRPVFYLYVIGSRDESKIPSSEPPFLPWNMSAMTTVAAVVMATMVSVLVTVSVVKQHYDTKLITIKRSVAQQVGPGEIAFLPSPASPHYTAPGTTPRWPTGSTLARLHVAARGQSALSRALEWTARQLGST